ncbi:formate/nitrite transporter family protein [Exophiala viscosa]|uniref:Formate/nitrite transporter family protein n=1 Tax=Exophiala viscosa TaxID=2486360 RepID=A0AAN6ICL1_9EURO|nr:formate/nitrite transporter family protein [Exophiala viscosa]KAI1623033.1 formate/nitrite transporter family protein [Exophiala viscosa]
MYNCYTPQETTEIVSRAGAIKGNTRLDKVFFSAVSAGCLLAFACATALSTNASPWYQENAPGLIRTISAIVFPYGLCSIILTGADLCTGSFMFTGLAVLHRRLSIVKMLIHWVVTFFGNLAGSLFIVGLITGYGGIFDDAGYKTEAVKFATTKQVTPEWHEIFLRGIGANWLVCLACFLGMSGREYFSKIVGIWWPTFAFVSLGFDHVVANMFFVPMGIFQGADISVGLYIWKGIIPAGLGNIVGGFLFVGAYYWYQYLAFLPAPVIDGVAYEAVSSNGHVDFGARRKTQDEETLAG